MKSLPLSQLISLFVLAVSLFISFLLWKDARHTAVQVLQTDFEFLVKESNRRIEQRMHAYEQVLRGTVGMFNAAGSVSRQQFHRYVTALQLDANYPGIQGVGFSLLVPATRKEEHIAAVRAEGFPQYRIEPEGTREVYSSIIYLEPFAGPNLRAFGYDMYSDPVRRAAMESARDSGQPAISGKVMLVQESGNNIQSGFLMYQPVYRHDTAGAMNKTVTDRRANLVGWIYAPFRTSDLMSGFSDEYAQDIDIEIYDGTELSADTLMHDTNPTVGLNRSKSQFVTIQTLSIRSHDWTVVSTSLPNFENRIEHDKSALILRAGIGASVLLTLLAWLLVDERTRALQAARLAYRMALYDGLTDLPNRKLFSDRLLRALAQAKRDKSLFSVMFIDLDKFKPINDQFGHAVGDLLLKEVAQRLLHCVRESDTVARLGGDEFVVLFPYSPDKNGEIVVAEKILKTLSTPFDIAGHRLDISSSIGIAVYPEDGDDEKTLLHNADVAMYHAKKHGRNKIKFFHPEMQAVNE